MKQEGLSADPLAVIESALASSKVDHDIARDFARYRQSPDFNADRWVASVLAKVSNPNFELDGTIILSRIENILGMLAPYSTFPDLVASDEVIYIEASRPAGPME